MVSYRPYQYWREALAGGEIGTELPVHADLPQEGFFRIRIGKAFAPVAIFRDKRGKLEATVYDAKEDPHRIWTFCCTHPVTETAYRHAIETDGQWGDVDDAVRQPLRPALVKLEDTATLTMDIDNAADSALGYATIADDGAAQRAQSLRNRLMELGGAADKKRAAEKQPHLAKCKEIDSKWMPMVNTARNAANGLRRSMSMYETAKLRKAEEERQNEPLPTQIRPGYGKAASVRDATTLADVEDWHALFMHYEGNDEAREAILAIARKDVKAGKTVPGVVTELVKEVV
jgi:hypothetical protein